MLELTLHEPAISYGSTDDHNLMSIIELVRQGISYSAFEKFASGFKFSLGEWARFLHVSERSIQRYKKEQKRFDSPQSEKLIEIVMLFLKKAKMCLVREPALFHGSNPQILHWEVLLLLALLIIPLV